MQVGHFIKAFINNPMGVSTIFPASKALAQAMTIGSEIGDHKNIVEIGVGTGALTSAMFEAMGPEHSYTGFEIDETFYKYLNDKFAKQHKSDIDKLKSFQFKSNSAAELSRFFPESSVDVLVSSLPWSVFESKQRHSILKEIHKVIKPGGLFTFYNYVTSSQFKHFKNFKSEILKEFKTLEPRQMVWASLPPATVWVAKK